MIQPFAHGRALRRESSRREDGLADDRDRPESFMATFAAIGALLLDMRENEAALAAPSSPDAAAPLGVSAALDPPTATADAAFASAHSVLFVPVMDRPRLAAGTPPVDLQDAPDETGEVFSFSAPAPVLSSAPLAEGGPAAPAASPPVALALPTQFGLAAAAPTAPGIDPLGAFANNLASLSPPLAPISHVEPATVAAPSAHVGEIAALIQSVARLAFGPEPGRFGAVEVAAAPVFEIFGEAASVRAVLFGAAQPRFV
jgi:hypothetical protein